MKVAFTGTRDGMTAKQYMSMSDWFNYQDDGSVPAELHHGCCLGADSDFHKLIMRGRIGSGVFAWGPIHAHPCNLASMVCQDSLALADKVYPVKSPLDRNRDIVDACDVLLACPKGPEEVRSGTWSTVRYARKQGKRVVIFWPDGEVTEEKK